MRAKHYAKSHAVLTYYFNIEEDHKKSEVVADEIGVPYSSFRKGGTNDHACFPEQFAVIYSVTRYTRFLLSLTPERHRIIEINSAQLDKNSVENDTIASAKASSVWREVLSDGKVIDQERERMLCVWESQLEEIEQTSSKVKEIRKEA
nr:hypothetical protein 4 [Deltaproteobacteria bacterium]